MIKPQARPLDVFVATLREIHLRETFYMVNTISNMQLSDLNSKPYGGKILIDIIGHAIIIRFYSPPESDHHKLLFLDRLHGPNHRQFHLRDNPDKNNEVYTVRKLLSV